MSYVYAEVLPAIGAVRVVLDISDWPDPANEATVRRYLVPPTDAAEFVLVRSTPSTSDDPAHQHFGVPSELITGGVRVWYDTEAPLGVDVWYRVEVSGPGVGGYIDAAPVTVLRHAEFAAGVDGFEAVAGASVARVAAPAPPTATAPGSLRVTSAGTHATTGAQTVRAGGITAGRDYLFDGWLMAPAGAADVRLVVDWYTAADVFVSTTGLAATPLAAGVWSYRRATAPAPATAARYQARIRWAGTPPAGALLYAADVRVLAPGPAVDGGGAPVLVPVDGAGWLRDPVRPRLDVPLSLIPDELCESDAEAPTPGVIFASMSADTRAAAGARFDVVEQAEPMSTASVRKAPTGTLTLVTVTFADRDQVHELLASGEVVLFQTAPEYGIPDRYCDVADVQTSPLSSDLRTQYRVIDLPHAATLPPAGPGEAPVGYRWADLCAPYTSWDALDDAALTGVDVLLGKASTSGGAA